MYRFMINFFIITVNSLQWMEATLYTHKHIHVNYVQIAQSQVSTIVPSVFFTSSSHYQFRLALCTGTLVKSHTSSYLLLMTILHVVVFVECSVHFSRA